MFCVPFFFYFSQGEKNNNNKTKKTRQLAWNIKAYFMGKIKVSSAHIFFYPAEKINGHLTYYGSSFSYDVAFYFVKNPKYCIWDRPIKPWICENNVNNHYTPERRWKGIICQSESVNNTTSCDHCKDTPDWFNYEHSGWVMDHLSKVNTELISKNNVF